VNESPTAFKRKVGRIASLLIGAHLLVAFFCLFAPADYNPFRLVGLYRKFILVGPFFKDEHIRYTNHLYVSHYGRGKWTVPRDYGHEAFDYYTRHPWRYDKLHEGDFAAYGAWALSGVRQSDIRSSKAFLELNNYVTSELIGRPVDSVALVYVRRQYHPAKKTVAIDTIFEHIYNPRTIHGGKKMD
jgi:hypothetical protein